MANMIVTLCGSVDYRGTYAPDGVYNGKDSWRLDATHYLFWGGLPAGWKLNSAKTTAGAPVLHPYYNQTGATPDVDAWFAGTGGAPPPTVTEAAANKALTVNSHDSLTPSIVFDPTPDEAALDSPQACDFALEYNVSESVTLTAPAADPAGWEWVGWYIGAALQSANKTWNFSLDNDTTVVATYVAIYTLIVNSHDELTPEITFNPTPDDSVAATASPQNCDFELQYEADTEVTLTAPDADPTGWLWDGWYLLGVRQETSKQWTFTMTGARFGGKPYYMIDGVDDQWLYWTASEWGLGNAAADGYYGTGANLPAIPWSVFVGPPTNGVGPAPTVAASGINWLVSGAGAAFYNGTYAASAMVVEARYQQTTFESTDAPTRPYPKSIKAPEVYVEIRDRSDNILYRTHRIESAEWELAMMGGAGPFAITFNEGYKSERHNIHLDLVASDNFPIGAFLRIVVNGDVWYEGIIQTVRYLRADQVEVQGVGPRVMFSWMQDWGAAWRADERATGDVTYSQLEVADVYMGLVNTLYSFSGYVYPAVGTGEAEVEMEGYFTPRTDGYQLMTELAKVASSIWGVTYIHNPTAAGLASNNRILFMTDMPSADDTQQDWVTELLQHNFAWDDLFATSPLELRGDNIVNRLHLRGEERQDPWTPSGNLLANPDFLNCNPQDATWGGGGDDEYWYWWDWKDWVVIAESENDTDPNPAVASTPYAAAEPSLSGGSGISFIDYGVGAGEREDPTHIWIHPAYYFTDARKPTVVDEDMDDVRTDGYNALPEVVAGRDYTFQYQAYWVGANTYLDYAVHFQWLQSDGTYISQSNTAWVSHAGGGWEEEVQTATAPANAAYCLAGILLRTTASAAGGEQIWVDIPMFSQASADQPFQLSNQVEKYYDVSDFGGSPQEMQDSDDIYGPRIAGQNISTSSKDQMDVYAEAYLLAWSTPYWQGTFRYVGEPRLIHPYLGLIQLHDLPVGLDTRRYTSLDTNGLLGCERVVYTYKQDSFEMEMELKSPRCILGPAEDQAREPGLIGKMLPPWFRDRAGYGGRSGFFGGGQVIPRR